MYVITFQTDRKYAAIRKSSDKRITLGVPVFGFECKVHDGRIQCQKIRPDFARMLKWTTVEILSDKEITDKDLHDSYLFLDENGNEMTRNEFQREINSQPDKPRCFGTESNLSKREDVMPRSTENDHFKKEVQKKLGHYVYRLIDPRNGQTFYVGKGQGNRVFEHVKAALKADESSEKGLRLETIREIKRKNLSPIHVIHRHNMSEHVALEVEAALIDAYPGLTNQSSGQGSNDYGTAHVDQLKERYAAEVIEYDPSHNIMVIKTKQSTVEERSGSLYQAARGKWRVSKKRAERADYILAIVDGICRGVFKPEKWKLSSPPGKKRYEFDGHEADKETWEKYVNKRLPDDDCRPGMAAPVLFKYRDSS